jgi:hypothetical protein
MGSGKNVCAQSLRRLKNDFSEVQRAVGWIDRNSHSNLRAK